MVILLTYLMDMQLYRINNLYSFYFILIGKNIIISLINLYWKKFCICYSVVSSNNCTFHFYFYYRQENIILLLIRIFVWLAGYWWENQRSVILIYSQNKSERIFPLYLISYRHYGHSFLQQFQSSWFHI